MKRIKLEDIIVENRVRSCKEADVISLAESIKTNGLIHPITLNSENVLISGGHRLEAFKLLAKEDPERYGTIPYVNFEEYAIEAGLIKAGESTPDHVLKLLEMEENLRRKSMTWQENALGIAEYHRRASIARAEEHWGQAQTAELFGLTQGHISYVLRIANRLTNKEDPIWGCESIREALELLMNEKKKEAMSKLAEFAKTKLSKIAPAKPIVTVAEDEPEDDFSYLDAVETPNVVNSTPQKKFTENDALDFYVQGDCLEWLPKFKGKFDHIITDPPYGIDMENFMNAESVDNVKEEHQVEPNLDLLREFLRVSHENIKDTGFMCMWYDMVHHEKLLKWSAEAGWIPCRWAVTWCKTSPCINRTAQYNVTKATEVCMMLRASSKAVLANKRSVNWIMAASAETSPEHPFGKPSAVWDWLIDTISFEGQTILDPFAGCGSSLLSILRKKRVPMGIEIKSDHIINGSKWIATKVNSYAI